MKNAKPLTRNDTIVAIATAPGRGAIAIVRLSGPRAAEITRRVCTPWPPEVRVATLATVHSPDEPEQVIDHGLVTHFPAPHSYTGEDVVEFAVHGGALVSTLVVAACVNAGARPALPGEFTERAVLHGKMDLVQAEAVADLIDARSRAAHRAAVRQLDGALSRRLTAMRDTLLQVDALLVYDMDFPEEDEAAPSRERVLAACDEAMAQVGRLLATLPAAALGREGALVVVAGPPNAGKSSLLNALVGEARVLVSEVPGTTRDAVEVLVDDTPYPLRLVDTAGLREGGDTLERLGIEVSERYVAQAHVVLACAASDAELARTVGVVRGLTVGVVIPVLTKMDLCFGLSRRPEGTEDAEGAFEGGVGEGVVCVSATTVDEAERYKKIAVDHAAVDRLLVDVFLHAHPVPPTEIVLDLDATDDPIHGAQEGRFFHGYYGCYCYLPLYIFAGEHLLCARLRPANIDASAGALEEVDRLVAQLRAAWPTVRITLRADSGFCRDALMTWAEAQAVDFVFGLAKNDRLLALIPAELAAAAAQCATTGQPERVFAERTYQTRDSWSRARRVVAKAEQLTGGADGKSNPRFVVTSLPVAGIDARTLYEDLYCARGEMENRIKEQQLMLFADRTSAATMRANQLRLYFSSVAYLLLHALRRLALVGTALAQAQCQTIRLKLLKIGARIRITVRNVWLALASGCPYAALFAQVHATLRRC